MIRINEENYPAIDISTINTHISTDIDSFIDSCELEYDEKINEAASEIIKNRTEKPIVLVSGPSGSGKTTTALKIEKRLNELGFEAQTLPMDNYFKPLNSYEIPKDFEGNNNYESPLCVDSKLFSEHVNKLAEYKDIYMPIFDFSAQKRTGEPIKISRNENEIIIIEGIHALNPKVVSNVEHLSTNIYVSVRTRIVENGNVIITPEFIRILRRLFRDKRTRGQSYSDTIRRFQSVKRGEFLNILPYKHRANIQINSFIPYELCVYSEMLLKQLSEIPFPLLEDTHMLESFNNIRKVAKIDSSKVPNNSLIREFVGY